VGRSLRRALIKGRVASAVNPPSGKQGERRIHGAFIQITEHDPHLAAGPAALQMARPPTCKARAPRTLALLTIEEGSDEDSLEGRIRSERRLLRCHQGRLFGTFAGLGYLSD
jgi:hypothetical protein